MKQLPILKKMTVLLSSLSITCVLGLAATSSQANIEIYKSIGKHGEIKYSQHRPRDAKDVELIVLRSDGRQVNAGQMAGKTDPNQQRTELTPEEQRIADLEARVKEQEKQALDRRCQTLRSRLANLKLGGRVYETDANGERTYLDERQIELEREKAQKAIDQYCSGGTTT